MADERFGDAPPLESAQPLAASDDDPDSEELHTDQGGETFTDSNSLNGLPSAKTEISSTNSNSSASSSSILYGVDKVIDIEGKLSGHSTKVIMNHEKKDVEIIATLDSSNFTNKDGLLGDSATVLPAEQTEKAPYGSSAPSVSSGKNVSDIIINSSSKSNGNHGNTFTPTDAASVPGTREVTQECPGHGTESDNSRIQTNTEGSQAHTGSIQFPAAGVEEKARRSEHVVLSANGQAAAAASKGPSVEPDEIETPQAEVNTEETGEGVPVNAVKTSMAVVINGRDIAHNIMNTAPASMSTMSKTPSPSESLSRNLPRPQPASSNMGASASHNWVSFEEEEASSPRSKPDKGKKQDWVQFDASPTMPRHSMVPQLTGGSSVHSCDPASEDRQSDITMSVLSSRGSLSESHDNVSHDYLPLTPSPLASSPAPHLRSTGATTPSSISSWIRFEDPGEFPPRPTPSPATQLPLQMQLPSTVQGRPTSVSPTSGISTPDHTVSQQICVPRPHGKGQQAGEKYMAGWVSFDEPDSSASSSPVRSQQTEKEAAEKRLQLQQLQRSIALQQQQQQVQSRQQQQHQQQQPGLIQLPYQQPPQPPVSLITPQQQAALSPPDLPTQPISYLADKQSSVTVPPTTSTPLPGNPFREEVLRQQNRAVSPFNPFQSCPAQTPSTPGGTVGAMWGESPITPGTVSAMWEEFEANSAQAASVPRSPGNPFATSVNTNAFNAQTHQVALTFMPSKESGPSQPQSLQNGATATGTTLTEHAKIFQEQDEPPSVSAPSSTSVQGTPVTSQPFQRYTKSSKQVTIRASGKRPKATQTQPDSVVIDTTPFVDEFPREKCDLAEGWPMMLRCPDKKKIAGSRYWKPVRIKLLEGNVIQLFSNENSSEPFRELPLQCSYEFGDRKTQAYDMLGKIHTVKLLYVHYSEKRRYNTRTPYEKVMSANPLLKLGSTDYNVFRSFISTINDYLMKLSSFRDRGISYKQDAMGVVVSDDYRCRVTSNGELEKQSVSVDVTVLAFLSDMPECSIALNDLQVKGVEVVSRRDIIPNKTNQWIQLENVELHKCANKNVFAESRSIEFVPLDGCCFSLMKFQTRPRQNAELPLHLKVTASGEGTFLELRVDLLLPGRPGRRDPSQITCENIMVRIPIPETWIKYFRKEKRLGFYSVKSSHGKPDHIKQGSLNPRLLETSIGAAKYEHAYRAIVWRIERLPEKPTVFSASHILMCRIHLTSHREVPRTPQGDVQMEFTMPHTTASRTTVRSLSVASDKPSEKRIRYMAHYEYFVEMETNVVLQILDADEAPSQCLQQ